MIIKRHVYCMMEVIKKPKKTPKTFKNVCFYCTRHTLWVLSEWAIGMPTAGLTTRAIACEFYVFYLLKPVFKDVFREFGYTSYFSYNHWLLEIIPALHIQHPQAKNQLRAATQTALGLHNQRSFTPNVKYCLSVAHLQACGFNWPQLVSNVLKCSLERYSCHGEILFSLYRSDAKQSTCIWHCVDEQFANISVLGWVAHGDCRLCQRLVYFVDDILNALEYHDKILRFTVVLFFHVHHLISSGPCCRTSWSSLV